MNVTARLTGTAALTGLLLTAGLTTASADTRGHWATIGELNAGTKTAAVSQPSIAGFPSATLTTDSSLSAPIGRISGANTWLGEGTEVGATYGSSRNQPYLNLRPARNNASAPSTSTYTFDSPTPASGWSFTLGDIDAEFLQITATGIDGAPVDAADLGFRSSFNYCGTGAGTTTCSSGRPQTVPTWDPTTGLLTGPGPDELASWSDTDGAAAWFEPTVPLTSVTVTSTWLTGSPTYQTWFAALSRDITGTVTGTADCPAEGLQVVVLDGDGSPVADTETDENGSWTVDDLATYDDWTVTVTPPEGCVVDPEGDLTADLSQDDAVVDVDLQPDEAPTPTPEPTDPTPTTPAPDPTVAPTSPGPSVSPAEQVTSPLPDTGGSAPWWLVGAGALLLAGAAAIGADSRRRR